MIPKTVADLTPEWLTGAIDATGSVVGVVSEPVGVGVGLVGQLHRLHLTWAGDGPATIIAKLAAEGEESRFVATVLNMYGREHGFYTELSPHTRLAHPHCYFSAHDPGTQDSVLLLEDVSERGTMRDQIAGARVGDAAGIVDALADFHADWWNSDELGRYEWLKALGDDPYPGAVQLAFGAGWPNVQEQFADECTPEVVALGDAHVGRTPALFAKLSEPPVVLSHADYRLDNMFIQNDGRPVVVDWQLIDRSVGPRDLAYLVTQSLDIDDPNDYDAILDRYIERLHRRDVDVDPVWAREQYRYGTLMGFTYPVVAGGSLTVSDPRHLELCRAMLRRCTTALRALDCFDLEL